MAEGHGQNIGSCLATKKHSILRSDGESASYVSLLKHCSAKPADLINSDGQMASKDTPTIVPDRQLGFKLEFITSLTSYNNLKLGRNPLLSRRRCGLASFFCTCRLCLHMLLCLPSVSWHGTWESSDAINGHARGEKERPRACPATEGNPKP